MDIATLIGIAGGMALLLIAILLEGSNPLMFINLLATVVVVFGSFAAVLARYTMGGFMTALIGGIKSSVFYKRISPVHLIDQLTEIADKMRKQGPIALEQVQIDDPFFQRGVRMIADGYSAQALRESLERERDLDYERLDDSQKIYKTLGEAAPSMGMVGTLIGLVSMFAHMDDPKKIGPAMSIALINTLYGAVFSNVIFLPMADKLGNRAAEESTNRTLIIEALVMVREGRNPSVIKDELASYLPLHNRDELLQAA